MPPQTSGQSSPFERELGTRSVTRTERALDQKALPESDADTGNQRLWLSSKAKMSALACVACAQKSPMMPYLKGDPPWSALEAGNHVNLLRVALAGLG